MVDLCCSFYTTAHAHIFNTNSIQNVYQSCSGTCMFVTHIVMCVIYLQNIITSVSTIVSYTLLYMHSQIFNTIIMVWRSGTCLLPQPLQLCACISGVQNTIMSVSTIVSWKMHAQIFFIIIVWLLILFWYMFVTYLQNTIMQVSTIVSYLLHTHRS